MNINDLLNELETEIEKSSTFPLTGKKIIDKDILLDITKDIRDTLPEEMSEARGIVQEKTRILNEAEKLAQDRIQEAEQRLAAMVDEHEITKAATVKADRIIAAANDNAMELRLGTQQYADEILADLQRYIGEYTHIIQRNREEIQVPGAKTEQQQQEAVLEEDN